MKKNDGGKISKNKKNKQKNKKNKQEKLARNNIY